MKPKSIFSKSSYKQILSSFTYEREARGQLSRLSEAAGCQVSYMSRVISGTIHLTPDQGFRICKFMNLTEIERDYFMTLLEFERSGDSDHQKFLKNKIEKLRAEFENISQHVDLPTLDLDAYNINYHSSWFWSAIHFMTSIPEYQTAPAIANKVHLPIVQVQHILKELSSAGFVEHVKGKWVYKSGAGHLSKGSPLLSYYHQNWRGRAATDQQNPESDGLHYTVLQTVSRKDIRKLRELILETIEKMSKISGPSNPEELVCFTCDFFKS